MELYADNHSKARYRQLLITLDDCHVGDLLVRPAAGQQLAPRAAELLTALTAWSKLGASLAALGPHRLPLAARAATAAAGGTAAEEEDAIAQWFTGVIDEAIRRGGLLAATAIWLLLVGDDHAGPFEARRPRCPVVAEVPPPPHGCVFELGFEADPPRRAGPDDPDPEVTFLAALRAAAAGYVHTAIAGASDHDLRALVELFHTGDVLESYRPWGGDVGDDAPSDSLERARSLLSCRRLSSFDACSGFADWAHGLAGMVAEHALRPVQRIGAIFWLARVALRDEERAA